MFMEKQQTISLCTVFLSWNARRSVRSPQEHFIIILIIGDQRD